MASSQSNTRVKPKKAEQPRSRPRRVSSKNSLYVSCCTVSGQDIAESGGVNAAADHIDNYFVSFTVNMHRQDLHLRCEATILQVDAEPNAADTNFATKLEVKGICTGAPVDVYIFRSSPITLKSPKMGFARLDCADVLGVGGGDVEAASPTWAHTPTRVDRPVRPPSMYRVAAPALLADEIPHPCLDWGSDPSRRPHRGSFELRDRGGCHPKEGDSRCGPTPPPPFATPLPPPNQ
ncbi:hypothetical protein J6590_023635 [Homalodisca vitripennis]|nr:hypothetical protein J6590_023635 [Homalodisca vitripennis]